MNYIAQINAFQDWAQINSPSTAQVAMWYALMDINNRCGWREWFSAPYSMIEVRTGISRSGITKTRNALTNAGLIEFKNQGGSCAALYKIILLGSEIVATNLTTNVVTNVASSEIVATNGSSEWPQMGHIPKDSTTASITTTATSEAYLTIGDIHTKVFKTFSMSGLMSEYVMNLKSRGMDDDFIRELMLETGESANSPNLRLMQTIGERWIRDGVKSRAQAAADKEAKKVGEQDAKHGGRTQGVRLGENQAQSSRHEGESKVYPGRWDDTPIQMPKLSG